MGISPDEDLTSYVHVAHGLEVSSQTNRSQRGCSRIMGDKVSGKRNMLHQREASKKTTVRAFQKELTRCVRLADCWQAQDG
jgi:hypothetical protein